MRSIGFYVSIGLSGLFLGACTLGPWILTKRVGRPMTPREFAVFMGGFLYAGVCGAVAYILACDTPPAALAIFACAAALSSWSAFWYSSPVSTASAPTGRWVRCTPEEGGLRQRQRRIARWRSAIVTACCVALLLIFIRAGAEPARRNAGMFVTWKDVPNRLPFALVTGVGFAVLYLLTSRGDGKPILICPKCEQSKYDDGIIDCGCGGQFVNIEEMRWGNDA